MLQVRLIIWILEYESWFNLRMLAWFMKSMPFPTQNHHSLETSPASFRNEYILVMCRFLSCSSQFDVSFGIGNLMQWIELAREKNKFLKSIHRMYWEKFTDCVKSKTKSKWNDIKTTMYLMIHWPLTCGLS